MFVFFISVSTYLKVKSPVNPVYGPFLKNPIASVGQKMLLLKYADYLELWRLGNFKNQFAYDEGDRKFFALEKKPEKLLELKSVQDEPITCSAISPDGCWIVYSTRNHIRMFALDSSNEGPIKLVRIKDLPLELTPSNHIFFSADSNVLGLVNSENQVVLLKILSNGDFDLIQILDTRKFIRDSISNIVLSNNGTYLAIAGLCRNISIWKQQKGTFKHFTKLPKYIAPVSAMTIHNTLPRIVVSFTNSKIFEYDMEETCFTCSSHYQHVDTLDSHCIKSILYDSRNPDVFVMQNDNTIFSLKKIEKKRAQDESKKSRDEDSEESVKELKLVMKRDYKVCRF